MLACYLDFDGVRHDSSVWLTPDRGIVMDTPGRRLFEWESILFDLLAPHPQVKIVLSTSWVRAKGIDYAKGRLDPLIGSRVIGATFDHRLSAARDFPLLTRGMQILDDVQRRKPADWFAIDDDAFGWPDRERGKLILTKGGLGLSEISVQEEVRRRLAAWGNRAG